MEGESILDDYDDDLAGITLELDALAAVITRIVQAASNGSNHVGVAMSPLAGAGAGVIKSDVTDGMRYGSRESGGGGESKKNELGEHLE